MDTHVCSKHIFQMQWQIHRWIARMYDYRQKQNVVNFSKNNIQYSYVKFHYTRVQGLLMEITG
jgi:hypothetical protein